jgi:hypothetical protein
MPTPPDWNLQLVRSREARALLPKLPGTQLVSWGNLRVAHLDTGYTEHPAFGDFATGASWLRPAEGLNRREPGLPPLDPLNYEGNTGHGTRTLQRALRRGSAGTGYTCAVGRDRRSTASARNPLQGCQQRRSLTRT